MLFCLCFCLSSLDSDEELIKVASAGGGSMVTEEGGAFGIGHGELIELVAVVAVWFVASSKNCKSLVADCQMFCSLRAGILHG